MANILTWRDEWLLGIEEIDADYLDQLDYAMAFVDERVSNYRIDRDSHRDQRTHQPSDLPSQLAKILRAVRVVVRMVVHRSPSASQSHP